MRFEEYQINQWLENITAEEQAEIKRAFSMQYNVDIGLKPEELASLDMELLLPLRDLIRGMVLTKTNKPNMQGAYNSLRLRKLPRKTEFGAVKDSDE
ncbi:hypothetical protein ACFOLF_36540 [Paenibacillus sepulcri]|uniref:Uncharacterized protein n=1 Tax=Paenibacillus sepulcri TaxID=359917 RepID=A0ABS7C5S7_9BACL|nr:hypothetical protein [Paenibacillus sepulcri]